MDKYQLAQSIRMKAGGLDVVTRSKNADLEAKRKDRDDLGTLLGAWRSAGYSLTSDILWAEQRMAKFDQWLEQPGEILKNPVLGERADKSLMDIIRNRRSVRLWKKKSVPKEMINTILEAAVYAPTAFNRMPWRFFVVTKPVDQLKAANASNQGMFDSAPVCIYVAVDDRLFFEKYSAPLDAAFAMQNMLLATHDLGLGACLVYQGEFADREGLKTKCGVPDYCTVYCAVLIGYPDEAPDTPARMPVEEITAFVE